MNEISPVACFNRGIAAGTIFSLETDLYCLDDEATALEVLDGTPDDTVVLEHPECDTKVTAGQIRAARPCASHLCLPGGLGLAFYSPVVLL